jgi:hypothetical protein
MEGLGFHRNIIDELLMDVTDKETIWTYVIIIKTSLMLSCLCALTWAMFEMGWTLDKTFKLRNA